jgi:KDO2-lipid IV(A) lauroyltransferase
MSHTSIWHPRYWPTHLALFLVRLLGLLPLSALRWLGKRLGVLLMHLGRKRRRIAERNLALCFPEWSEDRRQTILRRSFEALGQGMMEVPFAWFASAKAIAQHAHFEGLDLLEESRTQGHGVLLVAYHFTGIELGGQMLAQAISGIHALYRPHKNPVFERMQHRGRSRFAKPVPRDRVRAMLSALRRREVLWFLPDQDHGRAQSVFVRFFGQPASTITSATWFCERAKTRVHPVVIHRTDRGMRITIHPALTPFPGSSATDDAGRLMSFLEDVLRQEPADYMWVHRRFKTRPDGCPSVY